MALVKNPYNHDVAKDENDLVNIFIDGKWEKVPKGLNVIEAAERLGKFLPHYCYHPKLEVVGNCRMCLFEMGMPKTDKDRKPILNEQGLAADHMWFPKPAIGCATTISEGMGIRLNSPLAEDCRHGVMEFLLINHPLDCPICDQAGECKLQEFSVEYGKSGSRFVEEKVHKPKREDIGERIVLDDERCIMCSRCVRFAETIAKDGALGFTDHGSHTTLTVHPDHPFNSDYSLNTVDICPVGALTSKDFRFKMRVWFLRETKSICQGCATGCNVLVGSREATVYRLTPRENGEVNSHWMCDQGRLGFHYIHREDRITSPVVRAGEKDVFKTSWNDAFGQIAERAKEFAGESVAILASGRMTNEELYVLRELRATLGGDKVLCDIVPRSRQGDNFLKSADLNANTQGAEIMGISDGGKSLPLIREAIDTGKVKALLVFHEDAVAAGIGEDLLRKLELLVAVTILPTPTTALAHFVLPGASFAEKRGTLINVQGRLQRFHTAIPLPGRAMEDVDILLKLRLGITGGNGLHGFDDVFKAMAANVPAFAGLTFTTIGDLGVGGIGEDRVPDGWGVLPDERVVHGGMAPAAEPAATK